MNRKMFCFVILVFALASIALAQQPAGGSAPIQPAASISGSSMQGNGAMTATPSGNGAISAGNQTSGTYFGNGNGPMSGQTGSQGSTTVSAKEDPSGSSVGTAGTTQGSSFAKLSSDACQKPVGGVNVSGTGANNGGAFLGNGNAGATQGGQFNYGAGGQQKALGSGISTGSSSVLQGNGVVQAQSANTTKSQASGK
jgi:hypothetical protein